MSQETHRAVQTPIIPSMVPSQVLRSSVGSWSITSGHTVGALSPFATHPSTRPASHRSSHSITSTTPFSPPEPQAMVLPTVVSHDTWPSLIRRSAVWPSPVSQQNGRSPDLRGNAASSSGASFGHSLSLSMPFDGFEAETPEDDMDTR